jgi:hypothetical protein
LPNEEEQVKKILSRESISFPVYRSQLTDRGLTTFFLQGRAKQASDRIVKIATRLNQAESFSRLAHGDRSDVSCVLESPNEFASSGSAGRLNEDTIIQKAPQ